MDGKQNPDKRDKDRQERRDTVPAPPPLQGGPPLPNDGPELVRDVHC